MLVTALFVLSVSMLKQSTDLTPPPDLQKAFNISHSVASIGVRLPVGKRLQLFLDITSEILAIALFSVMKRQ